MPAATTYDAVIVGGGPAGATAAIMLAQAGWAVAVVERKAFPRRKVCGEFISASSWPLLRALGVAGSLAVHAGPEVRRVGFYGGATILSAPMPGGDAGWGRALGREHLDTALLARAAAAGATVLQPATVTALGDGYTCTVVGPDGTLTLRAPIVIAAHGSWEPGPLPTQVQRAAAGAADLFAFKAHFLGAQLPAGLMPLLAFPGGYGGMVHSDNGRVSLSCCVRRETLVRCRQTWPDARAGEAVIAHIRAACRGVDEALTGAVREGAWLSAGPIHPGRRPRGRAGLFAVGNAAGEAHPIVAEGISMAIQSAALLCELLIARTPAVAARALTEVARDYGRAWDANFVTRLRAAALFAQLAVRPATARLMSAVLTTLPAILTLGAAWSGKTQPLRHNDRLAPRHRHRPPLGPLGDPP
jgi:flavin-dependent dehydrogenase